MAIKRRCIGMEADRALSPRTAGNENTSLLKILAIALMIVDHVGVAFFTRPTYVVELRFLGRIAFPLFAWCMAVGMAYTRSVGKYLLRLLITGLIAQPCYMLALNHTWTQISVFGTLLLGAFGMAGMREKRFGSQYWAPVLALAVSLVVKVDYGWMGVLLLLCLYAWRNGKPAIVMGMIAFCLYWGISGGATFKTVFGVTLPTAVGFLPQANGLFSAIRYLQFWAVLALPLMVIPMGKRFRVPQWVWYAAYPAHLLVIAAIRHWAEIQSFLAGLFGGSTL